MIDQGDGEVRRERSSETRGLATENDQLSEIASRLGDLARYLQDQDDVQDTLLGIVHTAVQTVPGAQYAGVSVVEGRKAMRTPAASDDLVSQVDKAQIKVGQGPCMDVLFKKHTVSLPDMTREQRWPRFTARAAELGVGSMLSFQLYVNGDDLGALNLYSHHTDAFTGESEQVGLLFAAHAAVAMADAQKLAHLSRAMDTRDLIGQAKGILMERHKLTGDQAFALLVRASQRTNSKLAEVARYLVDSGDMLRHR